MNATDFRTCPVTARRIHRPAETLVKANAVVAVVSLLIGAIAAVLLVLMAYYLRVTRAAASEHRRAEA